MKLLLTSGGITNPSIHAKLAELLGRPIDECAALLIPTAQHSHPACTPTTTWNSIAGGGMGSLGWRSVGVLELSALPSTGSDRWVSWVREADVLLVEGGEATYLCHWVRASGLADLLPSLTDTVWVGMSAGSMVMTPRIGDEFVEWPDSPSDETLGIINAVPINPGQQGRTAVRRMDRFTHST